MIKRLKLKYITLSMVSLFLLLIFVVFAMNMINYFITIKEIDQIVTNVKDNLGYGLTCVFSVLILL